MTDRNCAKDFCWDAEAVATLRELVAQDLSADKIAKRLGGGLSRSAVLGKINRLGLSKSTAVDWTAQLVETLKAHAAEGLSLVETAAKMGFTRNTILGKASRLKIKFHSGIKTRGFGISARPAKPRVSVTSKGKVFETAPDTPMPKLRAVDATGTPARIMDPGFRGCKWPINDPGPGRMEETLFCNGPRPLDEPYCAQHAGLAYTGIPKPSKRMTEPSVGGARHPGGYRADRMGALR